MRERKKEFGSLGLATSLQLQLSGRKVDGGEKAFSRVYFCLRSRHLHELYSAKLGSHRSFES
jgi:hypothetical protein